MLKVSLTIIISSLLLGIAIGCHLPHVYYRQAQLELRERVPSLSIPILDNARSWDDNPSDSLPGDAIIDTTLKQILFGTGNLWPRDWHWLAVYHMSGLAKAFDSYTTRAGIAMAKCHYKESSMLASKALSIYLPGHYPNWYKNVTTLPSTLIDLGRYAEAKAVLESARLGSRPSDYAGSCYFQLLAKAEMGLGNYDSAFLHLRQAFSIQHYTTEEAELRADMARAQLGRGNDADALRLIMWPDRFTPSFEFILIHRELILMRKGDTTEAQRVCNHWLKFWREFEPPDSHDFEVLPSLDYAADIMTIKQAPEQAAQLRAEVRRLKEL